jgi:hypothetical protein
VDADRRIERLVGVYDADGGLVGELRYVVGRVLGRRHCALCDVTHRGLRPKRQWAALCDALPVPVELVHLDGRSGSVRQASLGRTPCVLAQVDDELVVLVEARDIAACRGDVSVFEEHLRQAARSRHLLLT